MQGVSLDSLTLLLFVTGKTSDHLFPNITFRTSRWR